jgi:hypothetical protein
MDLGISRELEDNVEDGIQLEKKTIIKIENPKKKKIAKVETVKQIEEPKEEPLKQPEPIPETPKDIINRKTPVLVNAVTAEGIDMVLEKIPKIRPGTTRKHTKNCTEEHKQKKIEALKKAQEVRKKQKEEDAEKLKQIEQIRNTIRNKKVLQKVKQEAKNKILDNYILRLQKQLENIEESDDDEAQLPNVVIMKTTKTKETIPPPKKNTNKPQNTPQPNNPVYLTKDQYLRSMGF